jgi:hypothetical protein
MYVFDETIYFERLPVVGYGADLIFIGGIWGGNILRYDVRNDKINIYAKHSAPVTAMCIC